MHGNDLSALPDRLFTLENRRQTRAVIARYGALLTSFSVRMPDGTRKDLVLGFDTLSEYRSPSYLANYPYFGAAIGRYGNRIKDGRFVLDGRTVQVTRNRGEDHLHGGSTGFDRKEWDLVDWEPESSRLVLGCRSADGEEGFPGNLETTLSFELTQQDELVYTYRARTDAPTAVNLTHHSYFNLDGGRGDIKDHWLQIPAGHMLEQDNNLVVTGRLCDVTGTRYDFRTPHQIGERLEDGYDQSFVLDKEPGACTLAAVARCPRSGLTLEVHTTDPVVHLYTGQGISPMKGHGGMPYGPYSGFCLETQVHPNAVNVPDFPSTILRPGQEYYQQTRYRVYWAPPK
ncbi:MAG TPA: aldose epimerase family protein [Chitinophagaceae bacterium]|nr:aldose epimerase family protein [Chitinophagaceae bacterium]